ncbi:hypothetical protein SERLA73DRAFT_156049 [Serpula lacrymans var. lacrymans S7.3]|uniref:Uncharacterized protein n=1 Tax=Serpula lacrymans var. lacrymans (strain S7.3) TaxID=936435 RepID=F8QCP2_SERL3|nr:hypothetical protein SERLA73DRAFT_156049 [Serpula lacrymans var. lacrymans S7.3]
MSSHTTLQAPSAERAPNTNIVLLKAAVRDIEEMKITHLAFKDLTDKRVKILNAKNLLLKQDNLQMKADIESLKKQVDFLNKNMGVECVEYDNNGEDQAAEQVNNNDASTTQSLTNTNISLSNIDPSSVDLETLSPEQKENISLEVADSKIVKDAINEVFMRKMGVDKPEAKHLPNFPSSISQRPQTTNPPTFPIHVTPVLSQYTEGPST